MKDIIQDIKQHFKNGDIITRIIYTNAAVFLGISVLGILFSLISGNNFGSTKNDLLDWIALPTNNITSLLIKPYTFISHMFLHVDFFHMLFNMVLLYFLGKLFLNYFSQKQLFGLYILGGLLGALALVLTTTLSPFFKDSGIAYGASAAVMAIAIGITSYTPNTKVMIFGMFPVKLMWIGIAYVGSDLVSFYDSNTGGHIAHLAGAGVGYWFSASFKQGNDITKGVSKAITKLSNLFYSKPKMKVVYNQEKVKKMSDDQYNTHKKATQNEIDAILDKISSSGYSSLSKREKDILFQHSNKK